MCMSALQVLSHDWVMDCGRLPPVQHYRESGSQPGNEPDTVQQKQVLTALKKQVGVKGLCAVISVGTGGGRAMCSTRAAHDCCVCFCPPSSRRWLEASSAQL
jgi:hypothetical protein